MSANTRYAAVVLFALVAATFVASQTRADEGMWLFSNPPTQQIQDKYGVTISPELLENLQKSSLRFASYGSASFVSSNGLIMTNHHVGLRTVSALSTKENNMVLNGFKAEKLEDEIKCPGLQLVMLEEIVDVTARVEEALKDARTEVEADAARTACFKQIEEEAKAEKNLKCTVVTLYQGGRYHLYCYKEFNDVRLVFVPEESVGFFGGDPDNFEYPRYNLDVTFFRAYENDQPYQPKHFLTWSENGAKEGDLVLVSGHPARTNRFNTVADLGYQRDVYYPYMMSKYRRREVAFQAFGSLNEENARRIATDLFGIQNSRKNRGGILQGLQSSNLMQTKIDAENELRKIAKEQNSIDFSQGDPWEKIAAAMNKWSGYYVAYDLLEANEAFYGNALVKRARTIVRYATQAALPDEQRAKDYQGEALDARKKELLNEIGEQSDIDALKLADSLSMLYELSEPAENGRKLGDSVTIPQDAFNAIYGGLSPKARANSLVKTSQVGKKEFVEQLLEGGLDAVKASDDPALQIACAVEPIAADLRDIYTTTVQEPCRQEYAKIAKARFQAYGENIYPDATFTLRLSYGKVAGYNSDEGEPIPFETTIKGALDHAREHNFVDPYDLAQTWVDAEKEGRAPLDSQINFVTTNDIIGGNSGSPAVDANGQIVGLIFDGNVQSLVSNFTYEDVQSRAVLVHSNGIRDAIRHIYQFARLADELGK